MHQLMDALGCETLAVKALSQTPMPSSADALHLADAPAVDTGLHACIVMAASMLTTTILTTRCSIADRREGWHSLAG